MHLTNCTILHNMLLIIHLGYLINVPHSKRSLFKWTHLFVRLDVLYSAGSGATNTHMIKD